MYYGKYRMYINIQVVTKVHVSELTFSYRGITAYPITQYLYM